MTEMKIREFIKLTLGSLLSHRMRSFLTALGIAVGIASVILLTSLGEGVHKYVLAEFTQFGTNLIAINPGKTATSGMSGALINTVRPLTLDDSIALKQIPEVIGTVALAWGNAPVEFDTRSRRTYIFGTGPEVPVVWRMNVAIGRFLPIDDPGSARPFVVLGSKVRSELFKERNPLGKRVRIAGERYQVVGVMESKGQMLGFDLDDAVYIPTSRALSMFNREGLMEIDISYSTGISSHRIAKKVKELLRSRHGTEDFTITTQEQMLSVLGSVLDVLTLAIGALGGISLIVGGVGIMTIMTIAVQERTFEIGLLRALGAVRRQILSLFIGEAVVLAGIGGAAGLILGGGGAWLLRVLVPAMPTHTPLSYVILAGILAAFVGLISGVIPAYRAANLDPVEALRAE